MAKFAIKRKHEIGISPDELLFQGERRMEYPRIRVMEYGNGQLQEREIGDVSELEMYASRKDSITWINIDGIDNREVLSELGRIFSIGHSVLADVMNPHRRSGVQEYDGVLSMAMKMLQLDEESGKIKGEQLSIIMLGNCVITFQEVSGDVFAPVRDRIRKERRIVRERPDYLVISLIDVVVDTYLYLLSILGEWIELTEEALTDNPGSDVVAQVYTYKKELNYLRKSILPTRDLLQRLVKMDSDLIGERYREIIFDILNNSMQAVEISESFREILSDQLSLYHTQVSNRLNDIMKLLTIFSAVFIPLTFIAGIYGTNFDYIPELAYRFSYFIMLGVMAVVAVVMLAIFWKKGWLRRK